MVTVAYRVGGMSCEKCVGHVGRAFKRAGEVERVEVSLDQGRAEVDWAEEPDWQALSAAFERAGYDLDRAEAPQESVAPATDAEAKAAPAEPASPKAGGATFVFRVDGMTCASCVGRVEKALGKLPGLAAPAVNLATNSAQVVLTGASEEAVFAAVEAAGYKASPLAKPDREAAPEASPWPAVLFALAVNLPIMGLHWFGHDWGPSAAVQMALSGLLLATVGRVFFTEGYRALFRFAPEMNSLVALGLTAAWVTSAVRLVLAGGAGHGHMFMEAAMLVLFIRFGRALEHRARKAAFGALAALLKEEPKTARKITERGPREIPLSALKIDDKVLVARGGRVPADGVLAEGRSSFDESIITGESLPVTREAGQRVIAGAINLEDAAVVRVERVGEDSTLRQLVSLVSRAQAAKAPVQRFADQAAAVFVPIVLSIALAAFVGGLIAGSEATDALSRAVAVLVVACPCALGLATPTALVVGSSLALRHGILIKAAPSLESLAGVKRIAFDKTGTLTLGCPKLVASHGDEDRARRAAALAGRSDHPLSRAIVEALDADEAEALSEIEEVPGRGLKARRGEAAVALGSAALMDELGVERGAEAEAFLAEQESAGATVVWYREGDALVGLALRDEPRQETKAVLEKLGELGIASVMITGDRAAPAEAMAKRLGIDDVKAETRPEDKLSLLEQLKLEADGPVAMVGDGLNDAAALAAADIGIAMGSGAEVAREAGDVVLMSSDLRGLIRAVDIARASLRKVRQNLLWAVGYNLIGIPLAAGLFLPLGWALPPAFAGIAMALSSVSVVVNSLLLGRHSPAA